MRRHRSFIAGSVAFLIIFTTACDPIHDLQIRNRCKTKLRVQLFNNMSDARHQTNERDHATIGPNSSYGVADGAEPSQVHPALRVSFTSGGVKLISSRRTPQSGSDFVAEIRGDDCR